MSQAEHLDLCEVSGPRDCDCCRNELRAELNAELAELQTELATSSMKTKDGQ